MHAPQPRIDSTSVLPSERNAVARVEPNLKNLIPLVMVIVGGCETCAERLVTRALQEGSSWQDIDKTLRIVADMQRRDCFSKAVGADVVSRMEKPLAAGQRTLQQFTTSGSD